MPSQEEYYGYNYYRIDGAVQKVAGGNSLKITVSLPTGEYFCYPSATMDLIGSSEDNVIAVEPA